MPPHHKQFTPLIHEDFRKIMATAAASAASAWGAAAVRLASQQEHLTRDAEEHQACSRRKVEAIQSVLNELRKTGAEAEAIRATEYELEEAHKELHMPHSQGWMLRVAHGGALFGLQDFSIERVAAALWLSLTPGRTASGAQQAALLRFTLDASGGTGSDHDAVHNISLRLEGVRLTKLSAGFSLIPGTVEVKSLTISLRCVLRCSFAFGSDDKWVCPEGVSLEVLTLKTREGGGAVMSDLVIRWLVERLLPGAFQKAILKRLPVELGRYLQTATEPCELSSELSLTGTPLSVLTARLPLPSAHATLSTEEEISISRAAGALRVGPSELHRTLAALHALQPGAAPPKRRDKGGAKTDREPAGPGPRSQGPGARTLGPPAVFSPGSHAGAVGTLSILELSRTRLDLERWWDEWVALQGAWEAMAELQAQQADTHPAAETPDPAQEQSSGRDHTSGRAHSASCSSNVSSAASHVSSSASSLSACTSASRNGRAHDASSAGHPSSSDGRSSTQQGGGSCASSPLDGDDPPAVGAAAVRRVLDALLALAAKPAHWELSLDSRVAMGLHLESLLEAVVRRQLRLRGVGEVEVSRVAGPGGRLPMLLAKLKRNVRSAEAYMKSRLEWERSERGQTGRINVRLEHVAFRGPVDVSANINKHAQLESTVGLLSCTERHQSSSRRHASPPPPTVHTALPAPPSMPLLTSTSLPPHHHLLSSAA